MRRWLLSSELSWTTFDRGWMEQQSSCPAHVQHCVLRCHLGFTRTALTLPARNAPLPPVSRSLLATSSRNYEIESHPHPNDPNHQTPPCCGR